MMSNSTSRGELWLDTLAPNAKRLEGLCPSVQAADGELNGEAVRFIAVVPDANNHYPRAAKGEVGAAGRLDAGESGERNHCRRCR
ncbi:malonate decarboxylase, gamma subunit [Salmonella enterica subsp. arizonae]|uniref:Malonate decarboxylase, gamma subunit n=1 Tax=Salmonella enterica subsp. arizonae TaxID=59203 RepID=A0A379TR97_SALER|nr:malonate decarboxylase, gamma subunit [Salmonella enterica subsp. arizonae]